MNLENNGPVRAETELTSKCRSFRLQVHKKASVLASPVASLPGPPAFKNCSVPLEAGSGAHTQTSTTIDYNS